MTKDIELIMDIIILVALLAVLFNSIRFYKSMYRRKKTIKNRLLRSIISAFYSFIYGILVIFGVPYIDETDFN